jgi:hypothetical protein
MIDGARGHGVHGAFESRIRPMRRAGSEQARFKVARERQTFGARHQVTVALAHGHEPVRRNRAGSNGTSRSQAPAGGMMSWSVIAPGFPDRFLSGFDNAQGNLQGFFPWYTDEPRHSSHACAVALRQRLACPRAALASASTPLTVAISTLRSQPTDRRSAPPAGWINPPPDRGAAPVLQTPRRPQRHTALTNPHDTRCLARVDNFRTASSCRVRPSSPASE